MKNIKLTEFEIYLLQESLNCYKELFKKEVFPQNSIVTKEYIEMMIQQIELKLKEKSAKEKVKELNETA